MILAAVASEALPIESLIRDLAFILILGAVVTVLFKWMKQPVVLGYIVAGFLASPHFEYLPSVTTDSNIEFWAQIGIVVLLFSLGLEFSFKKLVNAGGSAVVTALIMCSAFRPSTAYSSGGCSPCRRPRSSSRHSTISVFSTRNSLRWCSPSLS